MTRIDLAYGNSLIPFEFDPARFQLLTGAKDQQPPLSDIDVGAAFDAPIASPPLDEILHPGDSTLIVVSDATRATASTQIVNLLVRRIIQIGVAPHDIAIIFATGIHRKVTPDEKRELLTPFIAQRIRIIDHDAQDPNSLISLGSTSRGTSVQVSRALREFKHVIVTGGIAFHYFAGFTGGRKSICPGLASAETISATHMLALDFEKSGRRAGVGPGLLEGNAVHAECDEIAALVSPAFGINAVVDELGRAVSVHAGDWRESHRQSCEQYLTSHSLPIPSRREVVITSCGGLPYDINLIQAHKALEMASYACEEGGNIVLLAECSDGLGRSDFLKWFDVENSSFLERRLRDRYEVNGQTAWSLLTKAERFRVILISQLPAQHVELMRMTPARSLEDALAMLKPSSTGYIFPRGASYLPLRTS